MRCWRRWPRVPRRRHRSWPRSMRHLPMPRRASGTSGGPTARSEEHTSELQSLMRISYAVFCLKKKKKIQHKRNKYNTEELKLAITHRITNELHNERQLN